MLSVLRLNTTKPTTHRVSQALHGWGSLNVAATGVLGTIASVVRFHHRHLNPAATAVVSSSAAATVTINTATSSDFSAASDTVNTVHVVQNMGAKCQSPVVMRR